MPSKTMFLFFLAAIIATLLPPFLISDDYLEVIAALIQARNIAVTALVDAAPRPSPLLAHAINMADTLFTSYANLCGKLLSGPLKGNLYRGYNCYQRIYRDNGLLYSDGNTQFMMHQSFCIGVDQGLWLPGAKARVSLPRIPVLLALLAIMGMALIRPVCVIATCGTRLVVRFARRLAAFGQAFLAFAVSVVITIPIIIEGTLQLVAIPIPAALNIIKVIVAGLTSIALVVLTIVMCWAAQICDGAWTSGRKILDLAGSDKGTQTPRTLSGICNERASDCKDMVRKYLSLENVLDNERHEHEDEIVRREKVLRYQVWRLQKELQTRDKKISIAQAALATTKEKLAKSGRDVQMANSQDKLESLRQEAKQAKVEGDNERLREQLVRAGQKIESLEREVSIEKRTRADLEAAQVAKDLSQSREAEATQKIESLEQEVSALRANVAEEQGARLEVTREAQAYVQALEAEGTRRIAELEQKLEAQQQQLNWKGLEANQAKTRQDELDKAAECKLESIQEQLSAERKAGAERETKHFEATQAAKAKYEELEKSKRPKLSDWPVDDLLSEVIWLTTQDDPFPDLTDHYWAMELRDKLVEVLPKDEASDDEKPADEATQASAEVLAARPILPCKGRSAKSGAGGGRKAEQN